MNETSLPSVIWDREVSSSLPPARGDPVHQLVCWRWEAVLRARVDRRAVAVLNDALGPFALDVVATLDARDVPTGLSRRGRLDDRHTPDERAPPSRPPRWPDQARQHHQHALLPPRPMPPIRARSAARSRGSSPTRLTSAGSTETHVPCGGATSATRSAPGSRTIATSSSSRSPSFGHSSTTDFAATQPC